MAKYEVVKSFRDVQDENHIYRAGDKFPRTGKAKKERIEELSTKNNSAKQVFIKEVE